jgi:ubiquinone/menaquinone biosynthesis C-methylase UbiE
LRRFNAVAKLLTLWEKTSKGGRILDIGCGRGIYQRVIRRSTYLGCDLNNQNLKKAIKAPNAEYICADATHLPFKDNSFDIVLCSEVLEHLDSPLKAIKELARASKKMIVLTFPDERVMERFGQKNPAHVSTIQGPWVRSALRNYGYEIIFHKILYFFLPCVTLDKLKIPATRTLLRSANTLSNNLSLTFLNKLALSKTYVLMLVKTDLKSLSGSSKQKYS